MTVVVTVLTTGLFAGCAEGLPAPEPEAPAAVAVVNLSRDREILDEVFEVVDGVTEVDQADALAERLSGPALDIRETQLKVAAARGDLEALTDLTMQMQQVILPADHGWPRTSLGITAQSKDLTTPLLMTFEQSTARDQYKLWGWVRLLPGVTMPQFAGPDLGSASVSPDDESLKLTPEATVKQYASILTAAGDSRYAGNFTDDKLREDLLAQRRLQVEAIDKQECDGAFEVAYEPTKDPVKAVRTLNGGALVMAAMVSKETILAQEQGCEIGPPPSTARSLWTANGWTLDEAGTTNVVTMDFKDMVAFYVPPADSEGQVSLVGYQRNIFGVGRE